MLKHDGPEGVPQFYHVFHGLAQVFSTECPICVMGSGMCVALTMFSMLWACLKNWFRRVGKSAMVWSSLLLLVVGVEG